MIINQKKWDEYVKVNVDSYGKECVDVTRRVMEILDKDEDFDCHEIICQADTNDELTGFMAGCIAAMVAKCHSRGEEFRKKWNIDHQIKDEGEKANKNGGILNPALMTIDIPDGGKNERMEVESKDT